MAGAHSTQQYTIEQAEEDIADLRGQINYFAEHIAAGEFHWADPSLNVLSGLTLMAPSGDTTGVGDYTTLSGIIAAGGSVMLRPNTTYYLSQPLLPSGAFRIVGGGSTTVLTYGSAWSGTAFFKPSGNGFRAEKMSVNTLGMSFIDWNNSNTQDLLLDDITVTCGSAGMVPGTGAPIMTNCNTHQGAIGDCKFYQWDPNNAIFTINNGGSGNGSGFSGCKITNTRSYLGCIPTAAVAAGSNGGEISQIATWGVGFGGNGTLVVGSTVGWPTSGTLWVAASGSTVAQVTYTGVTATSFTGCAYVSGSATGTVATGNVVSPSSNNTAQAGIRNIEGWDITAPGNKNVDVIIFAGCFFANNAVANGGVNSYNTNKYAVICGITTASANNDFDRLEMYSCDWDAPIGGMVKCLSVDGVWLARVSCGNLIKGALTAQNDLISVGTFGGVGGGGQHSAHVSVRDYTREAGGIPHGSSNPSDFGCTSDTVNVLLSNFSVTDNGVSPQVNLNTNGGAAPAAGVVIEMPPSNYSLLAANTTAGQATIEIGNGTIKVGGTAITVP